MDMFAFLGLDVALNPATVGVMLLLAYSTWLAITREPSPFASSPRRARQNVLRLGRRCALVVAASWVVTLPRPEHSLGRDVAESVALAVAVLLFLSLLAVVRAFRHERAEAREQPARPVAPPAPPSARSMDGARVPAAPASGPVRGTGPVAPDDRPRRTRRTRRPIPTPLPDESAEQWRTRRAVQERLRSDVRTHHLGGDSPESGGGTVRASKVPATDPAGQPAAGSADRSTALTPLPADAPPSVLRRRLAELSGELATMRRVAIGQKAELDFEREAHARSRLAGKKALEIAERALAERRTAIKLARRERRARLALAGRLADPDAATLRRNAASAGGVDEPASGRGAAVEGHPIRDTDAKGERAV